MQEWLNPQQQEAWKNEGESAYVRPEDFDDLGAGIPASFPIIGYRQSKWRLRWQGEEQVMVDDRGVPVPNIGVVLVRVPEHKSKRFWKDGWQEDSKLPPNCWSNDGARPDPTINPTAGGVQPDGRPLPISCSQCYWNEIGSLISRDGKKKMKACGDYKRVAVLLTYPQVPIDELANQPMLLTIPAASLKPLRLYGIDLREHKKHASARVTLIGFDDKASFQKFTFNWGPPLADDMVQLIQQMRSGDDVKAILNEESAVLDPSAALTYEGETEGEEQAGQAVNEPPKQAAPTQSQLRVVPSTQPKQTTLAPDTRKPSERIATQAEARMAPSQGIPSQPSPQPMRQTMPSPGGRPIQPQGGIATAVARPATPPPSNRQVVVEPPSQQQQEAEERGDAVPADMNARFNQLMGGNT